MGANIFTLYGTIFVDNNKANKAIDDTTKKGKESSDKTDKSFKSIAKGAAGIGVAVSGAAVAAGTALYSMATKISNTASEINDASLKVGTSAEEYQKWTYAAKLSGVEAEKLQTLMVRQQKSFSDAKDGSKAMSLAYQRLGIDISKIGNSGEAFNAVIAKLADMKDETERNAIANDLFGKSYADLSPLLAEGADGIDKMKQELVDVGGLMSNDAVAAGDKFGDTMDKLKSSAMGVFNSLGSSLIPIVQQLADMLIQGMPTIQGLLQQIQPVLSSLFTNLLPPLIDLGRQIIPPILDLISLLMPSISSLIAAVTPIFTAVLPPLVKILTDITGIVLPPLISVIKVTANVVSSVLGGAFNGIKGTIANTKSIFMELTDFIKNIFTRNWSEAWQNIINIFSNYFSALASIYKIPMNSIINGMNGFIKSLNGLKVPDWIPGIGGKSVNFKYFTQLRIGMEYIPYDGFPAILHKGERVLTASENKELNTSATTQETKVNINIDKGAIVINKVDDDINIEDFTESVMEQMAQIIKRKGAVFA